jgi:fructokinase
MRPSQVAVLGECVADAFVDPAGVRPGELALRVLAGGGPANTALALARLGTETRFFGRIAGDVFGELFRAHLAASGVDLSACVAAAEPATLAVATLDAEGRASYSFHATGTADWQWSPAELDALPLASVACLHTGSLALVREPGGAHVEGLLARARPGATISIDPNVRPLLVDPAVYRERIAGWCALADILRVSDEDLRHLHPDWGVDRACDAWHAAGATLVVITCGADGAVVSLRGERAKVPAVAVDVVDTVGAGDSFTAGLLHRLGGHGLLGGRLDALTLDQAADAARFAARVAALTCSVAGGNPPWADRLG